ncbi:hypothetical protein DPMN_177195 [Dreissena polymorpha]|uniref:Uncharacterized protein n=1 Tax=Dreissena polymorpha TaxID=45954 RepID=A0A9D4ECU8_DREPO|nr:hypothetical protein DPMN_177195 [Dreissena polymorpha]
MSVTIPSLVSPLSESSSSQIESTKLESMVDALVGEATGSKFQIASATAMEPFDFLPR